MTGRSIAAGLDTPDSSVLGGTLTATDKRETQQLKVGRGVIVFDDTGGPGPLVIAVPGMGDLRGEYRYLTPYLTAAGYRSHCRYTRTRREQSAVGRLFSRCDRAGCTGSHDTARAGQGDPHR